MPEDSRTKAWRSDLVIDLVLTLLAAVPWAFSGPPVAMRIGAVVVCLAGALVARYVTKSLELLVCTVIVSILTRLAFAVFG